MLWGWCVAGAAFLPLIGFVLWRWPLTRSVPCLALSLLGVLAPLVLADRAAYGAWTASLWNFVKYNVVGGGDSALYGVEGPLFYLKNAALNFQAMLPLVLLAPIAGLAWAAGGRGGGGRQPIAAAPPATAVLALVVAPVYLWGAAISALPHKEERFLFVVYSLVGGRERRFLDVVLAWGVQGGRWEGVGALRRAPPPHGSTHHAGSVVGLGLQLRPTEAGLQPRDACHPLGFGKAIQAPSTLTRTSPSRAQTRRRALPLQWRWSMASWGRSRGCCPERRRPAAAGSCCAESERWHSPSLAWDPWRDWRRSPPHTARPPSLCWRCRRPVTAAPLGRCAWDPNGTASPAPFGCRATATVRSSSSPGSRACSPDPSTIRRWGKGGEDRVLRGSCWESRCAESMAPCERAPVLLEPQVQGGSRASPRQLNDRNAEELENAWTSSERCDYLFTQRWLEDGEYVYQDALPHGESWVVARAGGVARPRPAPPLACVFRSGPGPGPDGSRGMGFACRGGDDVVMAMS